MATPVRVVLVDDHEIVRQGLKAMLARHTREVRVVGEASTVAAAVTAVETFKPDVVLTDLRLGAASGLDLARQLLGRWPELKVVVLTVYDDEQYVYQALRAGASGYLLKRVDGAELVRHLADVVAGQVVVDPTLAGRLAASAARLQHGEFWPGAHLGLSQRESEVLALMVAGLSNRAIAARLVVGEETVKSHASSVYRKLGVGDRTAAVATAIREGLYQ
ncbi:response regulator [Acidimicrobiaceae bacterium USS-CC1]|uniref:Response regulator n=1 Tax=Acidiferrimicrobium australe TaxID=2664430 RepID=A0ABW9QUR5_9ACTN|nr:response regulator [Acidiferrimicrobium australe]